MDTNMTFQIDNQVKSQMSAICEQLGMSTATAFNLFAKAFVRNKGMPFPVTLYEVPTKMERSQMTADAEEVLRTFSEDYGRMAE